MKVRDLITYLLEFNLDAEVKLLENYLPVDFTVSWSSENGGDYEPSPENTRKSKLEADMIILDSVNSNSEQINN